MKVYIIGAEAISPQETFKKGIPSEIIEYSNLLKNIAIDFKEYFPPLQSRRINRLIKTSHACAIEVIKQSGIEKPDAIITGSGLGCIESTEKFLNDMVKTNEGILAPTSFIQSTSNAIGAQIALHYNCKGYNQLYAQKSFSFELALQDALLRLKDGKEKNILVGGFDEITDESYSHKKNVGLYKKEDSSNKSILNSSTTGCIPGEGSSFFVLSSNSEVKKLAEVVSVSMFYPKMTESETTNWLKQILSEQGIDANKVDLVISGLNGDILMNNRYNKILNSTFPYSTQAYYKHMCGETDSATSFGTWFASKVISEKILPLHSIIVDKKREFNFVVIYNQQDSRYNSLTILKSVHVK